MLIRSITHPFVRLFEIKRQLNKYPVPTDQHKGQFLDKMVVIVQIG